tara:strand:+ start:12904 stop:13806 length:903 start_codon:yes stop_codon:yes gene_type:complete
METKALILDTKTTKKLHFQYIINPISGVSKKLRIVEKVQSLMPKTTNYGITFTQEVGHASQIAREAVEKKVDAVIAVGGDGTVNEIAKSLVHTDVALGLIPCGSGNGFARHLKIPLNSEKAIQRINEFNVKKIDAAKINREVFVASAGFGFDAQVSEKFNQSKQRGFLAYMQLGAKEFFNYKPQTFDIVIDGEKKTVTVFLLTVANIGQYGNNAWIAPQASVLDGKLNVCMLKPFPPHLAPDIIYKVFNKQIEASDYYESFEAETIEIINPGKYHVDGEHKLSSTDLKIKVLPGALKVIY